jgi:hypothetical protein
MAMIEIRYGATMMRLCRRGSGFWKRLRESLSKGPTKTKPLVVFLVGSRIVVVASL